MKNYKHLSLLILFLAMQIVTQAQQYSNDFENRYTWYPPWTHINLVADTLLVENLIDDNLSFDTLVNYRCLCDSTQEFGLGLSLVVPDSLFGKNLHLDYHADYRFPDTLGEAQLVFTIRQEDHYPFWQSYDLGTYANDQAEWFHAAVNLDLPADYLKGNSIEFYLWNDKKNRILIDNAEVTLTTWTLPSFLPDITIPNDTPTENDLFLQQPNDTAKPLSYPIGLVNEYITNNDTIVEFYIFSKDQQSRYSTVSSIDTTYAVLRTQGNKETIELITTFNKDCLLLRQSLVIPFIDSTMTVYRRNMTEETSHLSPLTSHLSQPEYYLDREGFQIGEGDRSVILYHSTTHSSTQLDVKHRTAYLNIDYWRDHPMIHYPLSDSLEDHFEDVSCSEINKGMVWVHSIHFNLGNEVAHLPRIMPVPNGYESGIIFTEHADWTDIRTHRAVLFGNEHVTKAKNATGGFVFYGIPMTKSVFYNNPDNVTNAEASKGTFPGLHATIKTDKEFRKLLDQLYKNGFDLCLHTPEQYTTTPSNLKEALDYMQRHYKSITWIDHGYNNGSIHNREDMVCDGLNRSSDYYAATLWQQHNVNYLWNPYYEENRMEQWCFDNNLTQPYPGFGDALPNRQITPIVETSHLSPLTSHLSTWSTPSTLDANSDEDWDYYYSEKRLQNLVDHHQVHITHVYPAWVNPARGFWTYDADSTIIALPGMNRALARIAAFREEHKILPMTIKTYLDYYHDLLQVDYEIIDSKHIRLSNHGKKIKGFTLQCTAPIRFEDNRFYEFRKSGEYYYVWFDLKANDKITILIDN